MYKRQASPGLQIIGFVIIILSFFSLLLGAGCSPETQPSGTTQPIRPTPTFTLSATMSPTAVPTQIERPTSTVVDCLSIGGIVQNRHFPSDILLDNFYFKVYLPPCYQENLGENYPVLYLLHGLRYDHQQWIRLGLGDKMDALIQSGQISPFIVILPLESRFDPPELSLFDEVLVEELIPYVDHNYRTLADKSFRDLGGLSRGAAWAARIGFEHAGLFSKVGAHSLPLFNIDVNRLQFWLNQVPKEDLPLFFIDIGRDDLDLQTTLKFADQLNQNNVPHEWYLFNQGHTEAYWTDHLEQYLRWYARDW